MTASSTWRGTGPGSIRSASGENPGLRTTPTPDRTSVALDHFPDARATQPVHIDSAISVAFELGITTGYGDNTFRGHQLVSRQETASFITRTLGHTNVRPRNLTAQHDGMGGIQVSLRDANFAPVANEAIDVFRSYFPDRSFLADGKCETRYITAVEPSHFACEIDEGDTVTDESGNKDYTASDLRGGGEDQQVVCGTDDGAVTFDLGSAGDVPAIFWVWTGGLEDTVNADTNLVKVDDVDGVARMGAQQPDHANVSGGLNSMMNQLEARMGTNVRFTLQLHGADEHALASPDASGNKYNLVVQVNELVAQDHTEAGGRVQRRGCGQHPEPRARRRRRHVRRRDAAQSHDTRSGVA